MKAKPLIEWMLDQMPAWARNFLWIAYSRDETIAALQRLKRAGFVPACFIDCGAFRGNWTRMAKKVFPEARGLMVEAQRVKQKPLAQVCADFHHTLDYAITLLGPENRDAITFYEMETGSSVFLQVDDAPCQPVTLPMITLDNLLEQKKFPRPNLIKLDIQGYELEVLKGALNALGHAEVVFLEVSLVSYNKGAPLFDEIVAFFKAHHFLLYDCCNFRRWPGGVLFQMDALFVRDQSPLRIIDCHKPA